MKIKCRFQLCRHYDFPRLDPRTWGQRWRRDSRRSGLIEADTTLETCDLFINRPPSAIATITVIQGLLVKLQVYRLMSGSARAVWDRTKQLSQRQEFKCPPDFRSFLKVKMSHWHMRCNQPCGMRKVSSLDVWESSDRVVCVFRPLAWLGVKVDAVTLLVPF